MTGKYYNEKKKVSNDKWDKENMDRLVCKIKKEDGQAFRELAKANGTNVNALLSAFVRGYIKEHEDTQE